MARNNEDSAWKEILDVYINYCIEYCFPHLNELIDWNKSWVSLDKELQSITKESEARKCLLDKLFKVYLKSGDEQWVLLHVEVQAQYDDEFAKRMFMYGYRIFDKYQQAVVSCAVLTDDRLNWRPSQYKIGLAGSYLSSEFLIVKVLDFDNKREILEESQNPFASVILAQLAALKAKNRSEEERLRVKFFLTKRLYEKSYTKSEIQKLYQFIDWLIGLPEEFEIEYTHEVYCLEESKKMAYISTIERMGIEKGIEQGMKAGIKEGLKKAALILIKNGFSENQIISETGLTIDEIEKLKENDLITC